MEFKYIARLLLLSIVVLSLQECKKDETTAEPPSTPSPQASNDTSWAWIPSATSWSGTNTNRTAGSGWIRLSGTSGSNPNSVYSWVAINSAQFDFRKVDTLQLFYNTTRTHGTITSFVSNDSGTTWFPMHTSTTDEVVAIEIPNTVYRNSRLGKIKFEFGAQPPIQTRYNLRADNIRLVAE